MKRFLPFLFAALLLTACGSKNKTIYEETYSAVGDETKPAAFPNGVWNRDDEKSFDVEIDNIEDCYNLSLTITIDTAAFLQSVHHGTALPLLVKVITDGQTRTIPTTITLCNTSGTWMGQFDENGLLTCELLFRDYFFFNKAGHQQILVKQRTNYMTIRGIKQLGLTIDKAELELPND